MQWGSISSSWHVLKSFLSVNNNPIQGAGLVGYRGINVHSALDMLRSIKSFGPIGGGADDSTAIQAAINNSSVIYVDDDYFFSALEISGTITFIGPGSITGMPVSGTKPTRENLTDAANSAARLTLLNAYYNGTITLSGDASLEGHARINSALFLNSGGDFTLKASGRFEYDDIAFYGVCFSVEGVVTGSGSISSDAKGVGYYITGDLYDLTAIAIYADSDGFRLTRMGKATVSDGEAWYNGLNGIFFWFGGGGHFDNFIANYNDNNGVVSNYMATGNFIYARFENNGLSGVVAETGANYYMPYASIKNNAASGIFINHASVQARYATITGNGAFGVDGRFSFYLDILEATIDLTNNAGGVQCRTLGGTIISSEPGSVNIPNLTPTSFDPTYNFTCKAGGYIGAVDPISSGNEIGYLSALSGYNVVSGGELEIASVMMTADTEAFASIDDIETVTFQTEKSFAIVSPSSGSRDLVFKHGVGNIVSTTGADITLFTRDEAVLLVKLFSKVIALPIK